MTTDLTTPVFLTPAEAAELLRVTRRALYQRIARGTLPGVARFGRTVRIRRDALVRGGSR